MVLRRHYSHIMPIVEIPILSVASGGNIVKGRSRVDMKCEGSSPDAAVRWFLDGDEIVSADPRGFLISHSRLEIPSYRHSKNAAESHSGQYRCMVDKLLSNQVTLSKARKFIAVSPHACTHTMSGN